MKEFFADLHVHIGSTESGKPVKITASRALTLLSVLEAASEEKGMDLIGLIDAHVPEVMNELERLIISGSCEELAGGGIRFQHTTLILGSELEVYDENCSGPIHVLVYFKGLGDMKVFSEWISHFMKNNTLSSQRVYTAAKALQLKVEELGGLFIPAHIFTPFKSLYGRGVKKSLAEVFDPGLIDAVELGLSSDTEMASVIGELDGYPFVTNSDAHSTGKIAREYQKLLLMEPSYKELVLALKQRDGRKILANYGLNPLLGKYHHTVCDNCGISLTTQTDVCPSCGSKKIIKGVSDRLVELADSPARLENRPPYVHQVPLQFIPGVGPKTLLKLKDHFGTEMDILHRVSKEELARVIPGKTAELIAEARAGTLAVSGGGGGIYGKITTK
ncbi:TIGR00375 family protein [Bacillus sp. FJAT-42376]|uniref:endonuclease Q family protein n=1 Tax=Bacillus sp. FJAT-42376 TaxID=2014076 RepID=UPI000F4D7B56|nr:endonuclease Q family protein [Bacillus sp. FJAT-42376]AZB43422.1 TIGR00375 family protein [Bacillus sp. FJAT-42376]